MGNEDKPGITMITRAARRADINGRIAEVEILTDTLNMQLEQFGNRHPLPRLVNDVAQIKNTAETVRSVFENLKRLVKEEMS